MNTEHVAIVLLALFFVAVWVAADRRRTLAEIAFERGRATVIRGRLPTRVLAEVRDVAARNQIPAGRVLIRREDGRPRVDLSGIDDPRAAQQLRNVIGRFRLAELRG
jgi:hypothetical protein